MKLYQHLFPLYNYVRTTFRLKKNVKGDGNVFSLKNVFCGFGIFDVVGNYNTVLIDRNTKVGELKLYISGNRNVIEIAENCIIKSLELWVEDDDCIIKIGKGTTIESAHLAATEDNSAIILGEDCMLAKEVVIRTGDSHSIIDIKTDRRINYAQSVTIGKHVWIGERAIILKGVTIGDNSIVGTGSIVTTDCLTDSLVAGIPAKIIKDHVSWLRERIY